MNNMKVNIWNREFELDIFYDCFPDEEILPIQKEAVESLIKAKSSIAAAKDNVEKYCLMNYGDEIEDNRIDNIFKYVIPTTIYGVRNENKRVVALLCNFRFDLEHGLAIVFENEKCVDIGSQDMVL